MGWSAALRKESDLTQLLKLSSRLAISEHSAFVQYGRLITSYKT